MWNNRILLFIIVIFALSFSADNGEQDLENLWDRVMGSLSNGQTVLANSQLDSLYDLALIKKDTINLARYYETAGEIAYFGRDYDKCLRLSKVNAELMLESDNFALRSLVYARIANIQRHFGNIDSAYQFVYQAKELLLKVNFEENNAPKLYVYNDLAMLHVETSQIDSAIYYYLELLKWTSPKDSFRLQAINTNLSGVFKVLNNPEKQEFYLNQALAYCKSDRLIGSRANVIASHAAFHRNRGNFLKAKEMINESIDLQIKHNKKLKLENSYLIKSSILIGMEEYLEADEILKKIAHAENSKNKEVASSFLLNKLTIAIETGKNNSVPGLLSKTNKLVEELNMQRMKRELYVISAKYYQKENKYKLANEMLEKFTNVNDSLTNLESIQFAKNLESEYEFDKNILRIAALEKQELLSQKDLARQRYLIFGGGLTLALISLLSFFLFGQNKKINKQKGIIEKALSEKDTLLREIHHRVKNNLQLVSSLLTLQSRSISDATAIAAINDGKARVRSMALIHQNLYNKENLTGISVKEYIQKLCNEIFNTYNIQEERIKLELDIQELDLDVDTVVPLGLIINELLTNSLKYAFPDDQNGNILIKLFERDQRLVFELTDNGVGMNEEFFNSSSSFGNRLVRILTEQLDGEMNLTVDNGTSIQIFIEHYKKAA